MADKRDEIIDCLDSSELKKGDELFTRDDVKNAMDEYMKATCLELLEYMAKNEVVIGEMGDCYYFKYNGEWITREQLFENFL